MSDLQAFLHAVRDRIDDLLDDVVFWRDRDFRDSLNEASEDLHEGRSMSLDDLRDALDDRPAVTH